MSRRGQCNICAPRHVAHPNVNLRPFPMIASSKLPVRDRQRRLVPYKVASGEKKDAKAG